MKTYSGSRTMDGIRVMADGQPLNERYDLGKFTDSGFEWTYEGAEPSQLALALLADHLGNDDEALGLYEPFMRQVVANFGNDWTLTGKEIDQALEEIAAGNTK